MKITRAMKKIARIKGEISSLQQRIGNAASCLEENEYPEDIKVLVPLLEEKIKELVTLKVRVMRTNVKHDKFLTVLLLGETKNYKGFIDNLSVVEGTRTPRGFGSTEKDVYKSQISGKQKLAIADACQKRINDLTDELDEFNNSSDVEESGVAVDRLFQDLSLLGLGSGG